jgi:hypothetical protein
LEEKKNWIGKYVMRGLEEKINWLKENSARTEENTARNRKKLPGMDENTN